MFEELSKEEKNTLVENFDKSYKDTLDMYEDYYIGGGRQWKVIDCKNNADMFGYKDLRNLSSQKGAVTRSGKYLYDITRENVSRFSKISDLSEEEAYLSKGVIDKVYEWAEMNVVSIAVDEKARVARGYGKTKIILEDLNETASTFWKEHWKKSKGDALMQEMVKNASIFGFSASLSLPEKNVQVINPRNVIVLNDDEAVVFETVKKSSLDPSYHSYCNSITPKKYTLWTNDKTIIYIDGTLVEEIVHNYGINPLQIMRNNDQTSDIFKDIPTQDAINSLLTRFMEVTKQHLSPAVTISDDKVAQAARNTTAAGKPFNIKRGAGTVMIMGKDGKMNYHEWQGIPEGALAVLKEFQRYFSQTRGIGLFDNTLNAESGVAKESAKEILYNNCSEVRDILESYVTNLVKLFFIQKGFKKEFSVEVVFAPMREVSETEREELRKIKIENAIKINSVVNNKEKFLELVGFDSDEISDFLNGQEKSELIYS